MDINREKFFAMLERRSPEEMEQIQDAYWLTKDGHRVQRRDDGERYFEHPRRVAVSLMEFGRQDTPTILTALMHDLVEDTFVPLRIIIGRFGPELWRNIATLSKQIPSFDPVNGRLIGYAKKDHAAYYETIGRSNETVRLVKCADRLDNLQISHWPEPRQRKYLLETQQFVLPLAHATHPGLAREITRRVQALEIALGS